MITAEEAYEKAAECLGAVGLPGGLCDCGEWRVMHEEGGRVRNSAPHTLRIREEDWARIREEAKAVGMTAHGWCVKVLKEAL